MGGLTLKMVCNANTHHHSALGSQSWHTTRRRLRRSIFKAFLAHFAAGWLEFAWHNLYLMLAWFVLNRRVFVLFAVSTNINVVIFWIGFFFDYLTYFVFVPWPGPPMRVGYEGFYRYFVLTVETKIPTT